MTLNLKEGEAANEVNPTEKKSILNHWTAIDKWIVISFHFTITNYPFELFMWNFVEVNYKH